MFEGAADRVTTGDDELRPTACNVAGRIDFDADDRMHYRWQGGTTAEMYRDDELAAQNEVAEFQGALDDGRVFVHGVEEYRVLDGNGVEHDCSRRRRAGLRSRTRARSPATKRSCSSSTTTAARNRP